MIIQGEATTVHRVNKSQNKKRSSIRSKSTEIVDANVSHPEQAKKRKIPVNSEYQSVQYDLPQGKNAEALWSYAQILNQAQKDAWSSMYGIDEYI